MTAVAAAFAVSLLGALALTPLVRAAALRRGRVEAPGTSYRKIHDRHVPRLGGIAIVAAFYLSLACIVVIDGATRELFMANRLLALGLLLGGVPIVLLGLFDDTRGAGALIKFTVQAAVATALYALGFRIEAVTLPFGLELVLGACALPVTVLWIAGVVNAVNLIDGLDGLAAGVTAVAAGAVFAVALLHGDLLMMLFTAALAGALVGFLFFNFNPATIFMGDTGSLFLGYMIAVTSLQASTTPVASVALLTPLLALGLPILDTGMALVRRLVRGQHPFQGDRGHIHHRLLEMGLSHRGAVLSLYFVAFVFALFAVGVNLTGGRAHAAVVVLALIGTALLALRIWLVVFDYQQVRCSRRRNRRLRRARRQFARRAADATDRDSVFAALVETLSEFDVACVELFPGPPSRQRGWRRCGAGATTLRVERPLTATGGLVRIGWDDGRTELAAEEGGALEQLLGTVERSWRALTLQPSGRRAASGPDAAGRRANRGVRPGSGHGAAVESAQAQAW